METAAKSKTNMEEQEQHNGMLQSENPQNHSWLFMPLFMSVSQWIAKIFVAANHAATHLDETKLPRCFLQSALRVESWNFACEPLHTYETYECCKSSNQDTVVGSSSTLPSSALRIHPPCFTARWSSMNPASTGRVSTSLSAQVEGIATAALQTSNRWLRKKKTMFFFRKYKSPERNCHSPYLPLFTHLASTSFLVFDTQSDGYITHNWELATVSQQLRLDK